MDGLAEHLRRKKRFDVCAEDLGGPAVTLAQADGPATPVEADEKNAFPAVGVIDDTCHGAGGTLDVELPDPNSVPVELPVLVEEAKNGCTMGMLLSLDHKQRLIFTLGEILGATDAVAAAVLEMTAENFRQCLAPRGSLAQPAACLVVLSQTLLHQG